MESDIRSHCIAFVPFGATGNLSQRLILPALFNLFLDGYLPERFRLIGVDRDALEDAPLHELYRRAIGEHSREQGIVLKFMAKEPGFQMRLRPVAMRFSYREAFRAEVPAAYETLLCDGRRPVDDAGEHHRRAPR